MTSETGVGGHLEMVDLSQDDQAKSRKFVFRKIEDDLNASSAAMPQSHLVAEQVDRH